jgi:hypothetical protein
MRGERGGRPEKLENQREKLNQHEEKIRGN